MAEAIKEAALRNASALVVLALGVTLELMGHKEAALLVIGGGLGVLKGEK